MKIKTITLGCKVNQYESQAILEEFLRRGDTAASAGETPDVIILNSCTVTAESDHKVRQTLRRARRDAPEAVIVLTGCMVQAFPEASASLPEADLVIGNAQKSIIPDKVKDFMESRERTVFVPDFTPGMPFEAMQVSEFQEHTRAFVKIQDGCNRFCSYCIIPYARGRIRSKLPQQLKEELTDIAQSGYREVVLTGINLSAYGQEIGLHLCDAVETACAVPGIERVRLGSLEPEQLTPDVIARLAAQPKLCPQFHLSLQSGCDKTLKAMNRHYTTAEYAEIVQNLRAAFENAAITTDVMVAFSGETEEDFEASVAFVKEIGFAKVHVFPYSRRPGTRAYDLPGIVPNAEKARRSRVMIAAAEEGRIAFFKQQVGRLETVLAETIQPDGTTEGYTMNYTPVYVSGMKPGELSTVQITGYETRGCVGVCCPDSVSIS